jgi:tetratricopeptide (TPR) repeat protein
MKKTLLLFIAIIALYQPLKAQDFVYYTGDMEKLLLNSAQTPDDFIKLCLASELNDSDSQFLYNKFLQDVKTLGLETTPGDVSEKHLKKIYQVIQNHFLKTYDPHAQFGDMIISGGYNGVNASILYAYFLEMLKIPYQIKQLPGNVYVVANPGQDNMKFETVDKSKGFYVFDDRSKQQNVNDLIKEGYIERSYAINVGVERAFDEFFYSKEDISFKEAVGLVYFNKAFEEMQTDKAKEAYSDIYKANILFPDKKNEFLKNNLMAAMIGSFKYDDLADWRALTQLVNNKYASDDLKKFLEGQFNDFLINKLINAGQKDKVNELYNYLSSNLADTAVKKLVSQQYFFENAQYAYITSDYTQALKSLEVAYSLNPNNPLIVSNFAQMILHKFSAAGPTAENLNGFNSYMDKYPLLKNNPVIASIYDYYFSCLGTIGFITGDGATGEKYMQLLIRQLDAHPDNNGVYNRSIARLFAQASVYYFHKQGKAKAISVIKMGLKYEPTDDELLRKLSADSQ